MAVEAAFLRRLSRGDPLLGLLFPFGLAMVGAQAIRIVWGATGIPFNIPPALGGFVTAGDFVYSRYRLFALAVTALVIVVLWLVLEKTRYGIIVRAGTRDPEMVRASGISLRPVLTGVFGAGVALAALAGVLSAPLAGIHPAMGADIGTAAFVVVVIGGLASLWGPPMPGRRAGRVRRLTLPLLPPGPQAPVFPLRALGVPLPPRALR